MSTTFLEINFFQFFRKLNAALGNFFQFFRKLLAPRWVIFSSFFRNYMQRPRITACAYAKHVLVLDPHYDFPIDVIEFEDVDNDLKHDKGLQEYEDT